MVVGERHIWCVLPILSSFTTLLFRSHAFLALIYPTPTRSPAALLELDYVPSLIHHSCSFLTIARILANARQSCVSMEYAQHPRSQVVQTSWAVLALIYGEYPDVEVIKKACALLMSRQKEDGRWEQEDTEGIFNKNCAIDYPGMSPSSSLSL